MTALRVSLVCLLAGCAVANPTVAQLDRMKQDAAAGDRRAVVAEAIACDAADPACAQLHLLRGDACFALARNAEGEARRSLDRCAEGELAHALGSLMAERTPLGARRDYAVKYLETLRDLIDTRTAAEPGAAPALAAAATRFEQRYPGDPAGPYYRAGAELSAAQDRFFANGDRPALCAALASLRPGGNAPQAGFTANYRQLAASIHGMRIAGECS